MIKILIALMLVAVGSSAAFANCGNDDLISVETNIRFCNSQCDQSGHQAECNGYGYMGTHARNGDPNGVREGFEQCHAKDDGEKGQMNACFRERQSDFLHTACNVFGCNPSPPPPPPVPIVKNLDFNKPMQPATDNKHIVIADFLLADVGDYRSITINITRDNRNVFDLSTYAVNVEPTPDGQQHVKITTYDIHTSNVARHKYSVAGTLQLLGPR